jgi:hypothetical protein
LDRQLVVLTILEHREGPPLDQVGGHEPGDGLVGIEGAFEEQENRGADDDKDGGDT